MGKYDREYEAFRLFEQIQGQPAAEKQSELSAPEEQIIEKRELREETPYYEIEYDSCPMPGVGKFVLKSAKIQAPPRETDPVREIFNQMRDIARENRSLMFGNSKFYDKRIQQENAKLFYRQGMFMKDFEDSCERSLPYSAYFPNYQMMGYGQLRTYFTWRTRVRQGEICQTSLSYAFLYLYELLNNIGVENPLDGLEKLMLFWDAYRVYDASIDKYVLKWLKDYHIYYELPHSFQEFVLQNHLSAHFPKLTDSSDDFDLYCAISRYDIRKSGFYMEERVELIKECFRYVMDRLRRTLAESHVDLEEYIFHPTRNMSVWTPFQGALFYPALRQADRRVVLSEKEIYLCSGNRWTFSTTITTESGKQLIGYCMKQMESVLRRLTKYKHKLSANSSMLSPVMTQELQKDGISLETVVTEATESFYREATRTVVRVDSAMLEKIRQEALATQEKLIVPEEPFLLSEASGISNVSAAGGNRPDIAVQHELQTGQETDGAKLQIPLQARESEPVQTVQSDPAPLRTLSQPRESELQTVFPANRTDSQIPPQTGETDLPFISSVQEPDDAWKGLGEALTEIERRALTLAINAGTDVKPGADIKKFADAHGIMLEVLMDGINEKSMDYVGDSLLDDGFVIYDDYIEQVKGMVESL